ncbi:aspartic peptidase domain-containing protein [Irpex rosettiformis]|uniref:Aspartic peptidase domain-containing protein n=1 Tax=Irpex rosettiformis TaxID=378272 RepID=A0ACB8UB27_9APHY|nr:aspartic peptidase domain-containing protein [Irpex rosettiformis]
MLTSVSASKAAVITAIVCHVGSVSSLIVPFKRQAVSTPTDPYNFSVINYEGDGAIIYTANVTLGGQSFEVQLDTGSSDLWVNTQNVTLSNVNDTGVQTFISYEDMTEARGNILLSAMQFGNFTIPQQAFINANGSNATSDGDLGLLGLSSKNISNVYRKLNDTSFNGETVMNNLFSAYSNISTYITFLLTRTNLGKSDGGIFTIGETDPNWTKVLDQTPLPVRAKTDEWITFMGGVSVNGKNYTGHGLLSNVPDTGVSQEYKDQLLAIFDTGTSTGLMPTYYWDAIYGSIPGISKVPGQPGLFQFPCDTKLNVTMYFNGTEIPINPLDISMLASNERNETICVNAFGAQDTKTSVEETNDFTLGDAFLRNVYILYNYGNLTSTNNTLTNTTTPYVQLLPTTIQANAWNDFDSLNQARIAQWDQLGGQFTPPSRK